MPTAPSIEPHVLRNETGLAFTFYPNGGLSAITCGDVQINLFEGNPLEGALANLYLRSHEADGVAFVPLIGPASPLRQAIGAGHMTASGAWRDISCTCRLELAADEAAWYWRIRVVNRSEEAKKLDVVYAQDVGITSPAVTRSNEAFVSQYIDHNVLEHPECGAVLVSRQNQPVGGRFPIVLLGSAGRTVGFCTDGLDFYGLSARETGVPAALVRENLPQRRRQGEFSLLALQAEPRVLGPGEEAEFTFFGLFVPDHPEAVSADDLCLIDLVRAAELSSDLSDCPNLFTTSPFLESQELTDGEIDALFGADRRHEEWDGDRLLSFFHAPAGAHVVLRPKELLVDRPTGRSSSRAANCSPAIPA
ncbi:hypothetical protein HQ560_00390 [bacterium]|nr:hypothetical protein [bacterium]